MRIRTPMLCLGLAMLVAAAAWTPMALAQGATTGTISGTVVDPDGVPLPGATVVAVHEPTGTRYTAFTRTDGRFSIFNVRIGGPYTVSVSLEGFAEVDQGDTFVVLGEELALSFTLRLANVQETVTVTAVSDPIINPSRTGATSNVTTAEIENLPTVDRSFEELARTDPYFTPQASDNADPSGISVAGRNNRYNNIQIDGSVNNDLFGLAAQGTPGGQTEAQPISLDAIQEFQLVVSPYDVRQGGFSGGGINAITRSGSNAFHGSIYYFNRSDAYVGDGPDDSPLGEFSDNQFGGRVGGPIVADKVFFFVNGEVGRRSQPTGFSADGSSGQAFGLPDEAARFQNILQNVYDHDPGGLGEFTRSTDNNLFFARLDANLSPDHRLTVRHNYVDGTNDIIRPSDETYQFPSNRYMLDIETNSTVAQLNSVFGQDLYNELRVTYQTIKGPRVGPSEFPSVTVKIPGTGQEFVAGTERFSTANNLDQVIWELNDDLTFTRGSHTITLGTHNEFFEFDNLFIRDNFGAYVFQSLDDFEAGLANSFDHSFSVTGDPRESAMFNVNQIGAYAGDSWAANDRVVLTYGVRLDVPFFPDTPTRNPESEEFFGRPTDITPDGNLLWSPRVGVNYDLAGDGQQQLRGGLGLFTGRPPYVWLSNQYGNTGIEFTRLAAGNPFSSAPTCQPACIQFVPDPFNQPTSLGNAATNEIDLIDEDFKFPSVFRTTVGYDRALDFQEMTATVEFIYSDTVNDILYQNLNFVPDGDALFDGRSTVETFEPSLRDVILLSNTDQGWQYNLLFQVQRPFLNGWQASLAYMYGDARSINDGNSSQARSNWRFVPTVDTNNPELARSDFSVGHRITGTFAYDFMIQDRARVGVSFFYSGESGRPYSDTFVNDVNGDFQNNDLIFVPRSIDDVIVTGGTPAQLEQYIETSGLAEYRGEIAPRNASRAPWRNFSDLRASVEVPIRQTDVEFTLDIRNFFNLLNSDWGVVEFAFFDELSPVAFEGIDEATGKPIYDLTFTGRNPDGRFATDDLRSRWQLKLGARFSF